MSSAGSRFNCRSNESGFKNGRANSRSVGTGSRRQNRKCECDEYLILKTVNDITNPNYGEKFWGCRNWRNKIDNGCNYFEFVDDCKADERYDERDLKIARQKKKNGKLKNEICYLKEELCNSRRFTKLALGFGIVCFGFNIVLMAMILSVYTK